MKLKIDRKLEEGKYIVTISVIEFSQEEQSQISKFGSPLISIEPRQISTGTIFVDELPLHGINHQFSFDDENSAANFAETMKQRVTRAVTELRTKTDNFTREEDYDI